MTEDFAIRRLIELASDSAPSCPELSELLQELAVSLERQPPVRQNAVLGLLFIAFEAVEEGEDSCGRLLLEVAVLLTAAHEEIALELLDDAAQIAKADLRLLAN